MGPINIYLNFNGNTEEAFNFYKSVLGGEFVMIQRFGETPESARVKDTEKDKLMHIALKVGNNVIMATDALESMGHKVTAGTNFHISLSAESQEEADKVHAGLSAGGVTTVPMSKQSWGAYFGMLTDKFGIQWMVSFDPKYI